MGISTKNDIWSQPTPYTYIIEQGIIEQGIIVVDVTTTPFAAVYLPVHDVPNVNEDIY